MIYLTKLSTLSAFSNIHISSYTYTYIYTSHKIQVGKFIFQRFTSIQPYTIHHNIFRQIFSTFLFYLFIFPTDCIHIATAQVMIPLSLYVTIELCKILQVYHIHNNIELFDMQTNKRTECRAMNITEELGQVNISFYIISELGL